MNEAASKVVLQHGKRASGDERVDNREGVCDGLICFRRRGIKNRLKLPGVFGGNVTLNAAHNECLLVAIS